MYCYIFKTKVSIELKQLIASLYLVVSTYYKFDLA